MKKNQVLQAQVPLSLQLTEIFDGSRQRNLQCGWKYHTSYKVMLDLQGKRSSQLSPAKCLRLCYNLSTKITAFIEFDLQGHVTNTDATSYLQITYTTQIPKM